MRLAISIFILTVIFACGKTAVYQSVHTFEDGWMLDDTVQFQFDFNDSISGYNMYFELEHGPNYPYSNMFLFTNNTTPSGKFYRDTVESYLAKPDGEWLGNASGSKVKHKVLFKKNIRFPEQGLYTLNWIQGMRDTVMKDIISIGLTIEKED